MPVQAAHSHVCTAGVCKAALGTWLWLPPERTSCLGVLEVLLAPRTSCKGSCRTLGTVNFQLCNMLLTRGLACSFLRVLQPAGFGSWKQHCGGQRKMVREPGSVSQSSFQGRHHTEMPLGTL